MLLRSADASETRSARVLAICSSPHPTTQAANMNRCRVYCERMAYLCNKLQFFAMSDLRRRTFARSTSLSNRQAFSTKATHQRAEVHPQQNDAEARPPLVIVNLISHEAKRTLFIPPFFRIFSMRAFEGRQNLKRTISCHARAGKRSFAASDAPKGGQITLLRQENHSELAFRKSFQPQEDASHAENRLAATNGTFPATIQQSRQFCEQTKNGDPRRGRRLKTANLETRHLQCRTYSSPSSSSSDSDSSEVSPKPKSPRPPSRASSSLRSR